MINIIDCLWFLPFLTLPFLFIQAWDWHYNANVTWESTRNPFYGEATVLHKMSKDFTILTHQMSLLANAKWKSFIFIHNYDITKWKTQ